MKFLLILQKLILYPLAYLFVAFQRILSPLIMIRISVLNLARIGGPYRFYMMDLQKTMKNVPGKLTINIFMFTDYVSNEYWAKLWKQKFLVFRSNLFLSKVLGLNRKLPDHKKFEVPFITLNHLIYTKEYLDNLLEHKYPYFSMPKADIAKGEAILEKYGVSKNKPFICFHNRDSAYLDTVQPGVSSAYHDYRDSSIKNYLKAAHHMKDLGYAPIRVGAYVKEKVTDEGIIDYPFLDCRNDFMDVYLGSQCKLFIGSDTGITIIPELFDVPAVYANFVPITRVSIWVKNGLFIPKRFFSKKLNREMTFPEIYQFLKLEAPETNDFQTEGIELVENTPDEILDMTKEMLARIDGTWVETDEMKKLQEKYWALAPYIRHRPEGFTISSSYLMRSKHLLEQ